MVYNCYSQPVGHSQAAVGLGAPSSGLRRLRVFPIIIKASYFCIRSHLSITAHIYLSFVIGIAHTVFTALFISVLSPFLSFCVNTCMMAFHLRSVCEIVKGCVGTWSHLTCWKHRIAGDTVSKEKTGVTESQSTVRVRDELIMIKDILRLISPKCLLLHHPAYGNWEPTENQLQRGKGNQWMEISTHTVHKKNPVLYI